MQPVAPLDSVFWNFDTTTTHQAIASFCILDDFIDFDAFRERVSRLPEMFPKIRQRIDSNSGLFWIDDEAFSFENHVKLVNCPEVNSVAGLVDVAQRAFSERLDLARPLWRFTVIMNSTASGAIPSGGVPQVGVLFCIHHTLADGLGGLELVDAVFDQARQKLRGRAVNDRISMEEKRKPQGILIDGGRSAKHWLKEYISPKARGALNGKNSEVRRVAIRSFDLASLRRAKALAGVSFNDLVLAMVTGAVRRYQEQWGEPFRDARALIPVNLRILGERNTLGNRITGVGVSLPVSEALASRRLQQVSASLKQLKDSGALGAYALLGQFVARLPARLQRVLCESQARRTNFICTNLPGKNETRTLCGVRVKENYALAALMRGHGVAFGFISYAGKLCVSVVGDELIVPYPERMMDFLQEECSHFV